MKNERQSKLYDEKACWDKYMSWGSAASVVKLLDWHRGEFGFGSRMGVVFAMWRWAIRHPEECYPQYKEWLRQNAPEGEVSAREFSKFKRDWLLENFGKDGEYKEFTFDMFARVLRNRAKGYEGSVIGKKEYKKFCNQWNLEL